MKVELKLDPECRETSVLVRTDRMTEDTERLLRKLRAWSEPMLLGFRGEAVSPLDEASISRIYAQQGRVCASTDEGEFQLRQRLYELEERLEGADFVRISNSELINLKRVRSFDLSPCGHDTRQPDGWLHGLGFPPLCGEAQEDSWIVRCWK